MAVWYEDSITFWVAADPVTTDIDPSYRPCAIDTPEKNSSSRSLVKRGVLSSSIFTVASKASLFKTVTKPADPSKDTSVVEFLDRSQHLKDVAKWLKNASGCVMLVCTNV